MNILYKEIYSILKDSGFGDGMTFANESATDKIMYISMYCPSILMYSKEESIKNILRSYNISVSSNPNIETIIIKVAE